MKTLYKITLFVVLLFCAPGIFAQTNDLENAIQLYKQGKTDEAVSVLERLSKQQETKSDGRVWNYLGLAYIEKNDLKKARKTLEKAAGLSPQNAGIRTNLGYAYLLSNKLNNAQAELSKAIALEPQNFFAYYIRGTAFLWERKLDDALGDADKAIALNADYSSAYILKSDILVAKFGSRVAGGATPKDAAEFLQEAVKTLEFCLKNCQNNSNLQMQQEKLEAARGFYDYFMRDKSNGANLTLETNTNNVPAVADATTTPIKILSKPRPSYTDRARQSGISGTITLYVLFGANGKILQVITLKGLGYGLDEEAVRAARQIKFEPMTKDGKAVSVVKMVQFSFMIY